jgi:chemotaxis receptor (MCP) glutamine deamidase CheD
MLRVLQRRDVANKEIVATLVGGANVLENLSPQWSVASRNVAVATEMLARSRIRLAYQDTGGTRGRVIEHLSDVNRTRVRYHGSSR